MHSWAQFVFCKKPSVQEGTGMTSRIIDLPSKGKGALLMPNDGEEHQNLVMSSATSRGLEERRRTIKDKLKARLS